MADSPDRTLTPLALGLVVLGLTFGATVIRTEPPAPLGPDAPPDVFSAARAADVLRTLVGDGIPHPVGSPQAGVVRERIVAALTGLGYTPEIQTTFACSSTDQACATVNNVIAVHEGREAGPAVLLMSHYDSVAAGPGASDAGVGVAAILEVARALSGGSPLRHPVVFLLNEGEEAGLLGAAGFLSDHPLAKTIGAVVNLEARGTSGASVMFETSGDNAWLIETLARSLPRPMASSLFYPIYERLPNDTDLTLVKRAGIPGVNFAFIGSVPNYHTPRDDVERMTPGTLQHHGDNALSATRALADADLTSPPAGHAVFFDVLGFSIVRWPAWLTLPIALSAYLLIVLTTLGMRVTSRAPLWRAVVGLVVWAVAIAAAGAVAWWERSEIGASGRWPGGGTTTPQQDVLVFWTMGLAAATAVLALFGSVMRPAGAWTGCWLGWATAGLGVALYAPEASYLFTVPALTAGLLGALVLSRRAPTPEAPRTWVLLTPVAVAAVLAMPPAWLLFDALGPPALPVVAGVLGLLGTTLAPAFGAAGLVRWLVPIAFLSGSLALYASVADAPAFSVERPERLSFVLLQEEGQPASKWIASPQSGRLRAELVRPGLFASPPERAYPWSSMTAYVIHADRLARPAPSVDVIEDAREPDRRRLRLRARSERGAPILTLMLPRDRVVSIHMNGREIPKRPGDAELRLSQRDSSAVLRSYTCYTTPADGVEIDVVIEGSDPVDGWIVDRRPGLPATGEALLNARPTAAQPFGAGDVTMFVRRIRL